MRKDFTQPQELYKSYSAFDSIADYSTLPGETIVCGRYQTAIEVLRLFMRLDFAITFSEFLFREGLRRGDLVKVWKVSNPHSSLGDDIRDCILENGFFGELPSEILSKFNGFKNKQTLNR